MKCCFYVALQSARVLRSSPHTAGSTDQVSSAIRSRSDPRCKSPVTTTLAIMKTSHRTAAAAAILAVGVLATLTARAQTIPAIPVGSLTAFPTVVQTGTKPTLTWSINYPSVVKDYIDITDNNTITPKVNLKCEIRILGAGVTSQDSKGNIIFYYTRGRIAFNNNSFTDIWAGRNTDSLVKSQSIIYTKSPVVKNTKIYLGGQYNKDNKNNTNWAPFYSSYGTSRNVWALVSGDLCPDRIPGYNAPSLETFLKPYLDSTNRVKIGPMDVIIFMELTHTNERDDGFDLQDLVLLVTFTKL